MKLQLQILTKSKRCDYEQRALETTAYIVKELCKSLIKSGGLEGAQFQFFITIALHAKNLAQSK